MMEAAQNLALLLVIVAIGYWLWQSWEDKRERDTALPFVRYETRNAGALNQRGPTISTDTIRPIDWDPNTPGIQMRLVGSDATVTA
jgi:hypothetical protein